MKVIAIVPAAGSGKRLNNNYYKPFIRIKSKPLFIYTLKALDNSPHIEKIILVVAKKFIKKSRDLARTYNIKKIKSIIGGGKTRSDSVFNGLKNIDRDTDLVLIHDGARPFIDRHIIEKSIKVAKRYGSACVCVPVKPTIKQIEKNYITKTPDRKILWEAQTPQVFKKEIIQKAYKNRKLLKVSTDDSSLVEKLGYKIHVVKGSYRNIKITTKEDLLLAKVLLKSKIKE